MPSPQSHADCRDAPSSSAALLLAALVGGLLGAAADRLLFAEPTRIAAAQDAGAPPAAASPTLQDELKTLSTAIDELKASVDRLAPPAAAPSPAALAPSPDVQELLAQLVAVPILQGTGESLDNLELTCSSPSGCAYSAYWDGNIPRTGEQGRFPRHDKC